MTNFTQTAQVATIKAARHATAKPIIASVWELLKETDLKGLSPEVILAGENGTGYFDSLCDTADLHPMDEVLKSYDRHGRMIISVRVCGTSQPEVFFERKSGSTSILVRQGCKGRKLMNTANDASEFLDALLSALPSF